jgi:alkanesulfonate monooxygenase SsuD/methylene tetrahydromethanopterin reductase-like flavin-dependent oxidoreductase (luciferase family)
VGLHLLGGDIPHGGVLTSWSDMRAVAQRADELGFDALSVGDHLLIDFHDEGFLFGAWECFSMLTALAASTARIQLASLVAATAYRNPALLAKTAATIDEISGGRLVLGIGGGWHEYEFRAFGFPYDHRLGRFEEAVEIITRLLRGECVTFQGAYYQVEDGELRPRGPRPGGPPIMIGARGPHMMALAARYADIWDSDLGPSASDPTQLRPALATLDAACRDIGRDPASITRTTWLQVDMPGHSEPGDHPVAAARASWNPATGTPGELADLFRAYAAEAFSRVQVWLDPCTVAGVEAFAEVLEILDAG